MGRIKMDRAHRLAVPLILLALILCLALLVGTAWARYRYRETTDLLFTQKTASQVYLWGGIQSDGSFSAMPAKSSSWLAWSKTAKLASLAAD